MRALKARLTLRRSKKGKEPAETPVVVAPPAQKLIVIPEVKLAGNDITVPVALTPPSSQFSQRVHPLQPVGFGPADIGKPIETNKWWGMLEVAGAQQGNCFAFPYTLWWSNYGPYGMNVSHTEASQLVFDTSNTPPQYYINPLGIYSCECWCTGIQLQHDYGNRYPDPIHHQCNTLFRQRIH